MSRRSHAARDALVVDAETETLNPLDARARAALDKTRLTAPFGGTVAEINGELGEFVTPSPIGVPTPPAVDLIDTTSLYVSAPIDEVDAPDIRADMAAHISLDAFRDSMDRVVP